jgi:hypothetical protein
MNQAQFQVQVMALLNTIVEQTRPIASGSGASTFGAGSIGNPVDGPASPAGKPYAALVERYGEAEFAKLVRLNTPGYPETNPALTPYWKYPAESAAFKLAFPKYF